MKKIIILAIAASFAAVTANAQLKVSSTGNVAVGTTVTPASKLSVGGAGNGIYDLFVNGRSKFENIVNAKVYAPTTYPLGWTTADITDAALYALDHLQVKTHTKLGQTHYSISGTSMNSYFQALAAYDEGGNYIANYSELVPVLVYGYQKIVDYIMDNDGANAAAYFGDDTEVNSNENADEAELSRPRMAANRFAGARLYQNTPNPFTAQTKIRFSLPEDAQNAYIYIFDMTGKTLRQLPVDTGMDSVTIQGYELSSGMYLYSLVINGQEIDTKRMILSK